MLNIGILSSGKFEKLWKTTVKDLVSDKIKIYISGNVSIATGHHGTPRLVEFPGQDTFQGKRNES